MRKENLVLKSPKKQSNDLDDTSLCSLDVEALRLFVGHRLVTKISADDWIKNYKNGLLGNTQVSPTYVKGLKEESFKKEKTTLKKIPEPS